MAHHVQVNTDNVVIDNIPYNTGAVALVEDDAFAEIPQAMFTSGRLTDLGPAGGGGGFLAGPVLDWGLQALGAMPGGGNLVQTQGATLYAADSQTDLQDVAGVDLGDGSAPVNIAVGDDFVLSRSGSDVLSFRHPGLYLVQINGPSPIADGQMSVMPNFSTSGIHTATVSLFQPPLPGAGVFTQQPVGQLLVPVWPVDTAKNDSDPAGEWQPGEALIGGSNLSFIIWLTATGNQDIYMGAQVTRVM